ncbi:MAG: flavin reductase family protein [Anaerolineae bacterium]|nr:flavin reductase family protein [Anaerolineae bacterium]
MKEKVNFDLNKRVWHPSPLLGQITLVTSLNPDGASNVAPKSWISMMALNPPILALGCNLKHQTAQNILANREFVVNVPGVELVQTIWHSHTLPHPRPVEAVGLTPIPAVRVQPPRIEECKGHLECVLDQQMTYGDEVILLGQIVAVSVDKAACDAADAYARMRMLCFLEDRTYGVIERANRLETANVTT